MNNIEEKTEQILSQLGKNEELANYIDTSLIIPFPFRGEGPIKLIILGQDPTIKDPAKRAKIRAILNLDKKGSARSYLSRVCLDLNMELSQNVYATNLFKCFFTRPPTEIKENNIFEMFLDYWLPLLIEELIEFDGLPVITMGEPVLKSLLLEKREHPLRQYWGYRANWQSTLLFNEFQYVKPESNRLGRVLFPFPHQPSVRKLFYKKRMNDYIRFVKATAFPI